MFGTFRATLGDSHPGIRLVDLTPASIEWSASSHRRNRRPSCERCRCAKLKCSREESGCSRCKVTQRKCVYKRSTASQLPTPTAIQPPLSGSPARTTQGVRRDSDGAHIDPQFPRNFSERLDVAPGQQSVQRDGDKFHESQQSQLDDLQMMPGFSEQDLWPAQDLENSLWDLDDGDSRLADVQEFLDHNYRPPTPISMLRSPVPTALPIPENPSSRTPPIRTRMQLSSEQESEICNSSTGPESTRTCTASNDSTSCNCLQDMAHLLETLQEANPTLVSPNMSALEALRMALDRCELFSKCDGCMCRSEIMTVLGLVCQRLIDVCEREITERSKGHDYATSRNFYIGEYRVETRSEASMLTKVVIAFQLRRFRVFAATLRAASRLTAAGAWLPLVLTAEQRALDIEDRCRL